MLKRIKKKISDVSIIRCPFFIAGLSAVFALGADLLWLVFDTVIKTKEFFVHPFWYGSIMFGLSAALLLVIIALYAYATDGLLKHEKKIILENSDK